MITINNKLELHKEKQSQARKNSFSDNVPLKLIDLNNYIDEKQNIISQSKKTKLKREFYFPYIKDNDSPLLKNKTDNYDLKNNNLIWSKIPHKDFLTLSKRNLKAGILILLNVNVNNYNNKKVDCWFLSGLYHMQHAIELLIKSGIIMRYGGTESDLIFKEDNFRNSHSLKKLYDKFLDGNIQLNLLCKKEQNWLEKYLNTIESIDPMSDFFRYPFKKEFIEKHKDKSLDIYKMSNQLLYCYELLNHIIYNEQVDTALTEEAGNPEFLQFTKESLGNCYLYESPYINSCRLDRQIIGYSESSQFLYVEYLTSNDQDLFYPMIFSMRHSIELILKQIAEKNLKQSPGTQCRHTHTLKKIWKVIEPKLNKYVEQDDQDPKEIDLARDYINTLNGLDSKGQSFRFPYFTVNNYPSFANENYVIENFYTYLLRIFNFLNGCDAWLDNIVDYESEIYFDY